MPAPSELAKRLAQDLVEVGKIFGFQASKEEPIQEESKFRVDVFWKLPMPEGSPFPEINIASIEIQYSYSPSSISHGILKAESTLHPAIHFVISYYNLTDDYKDNILKTTYPRSGLVIIEGEEEVRKLNLWITRYLTIEDEERKLVEKGSAIQKLVNAGVRANENDSAIKENIRETFQSDIAGVFLPPEFSSLLEMFEIESRGREFDREVIDDVFYAFISFVQSMLQRHNIPRVEVDASNLFSEFKIEEEFHKTKLEDYLDIDQFQVIIRDRSGYPLEVLVENGNARVDSPAGTICEEGLNSADIIHFIKKSSEEIKKEINKYRISEKDRKLLERIIEELS
jgi:hypothetical protein